MQAGAFELLLVLMTHVDFTASVLMDISGQVESFM